MDGGVSVSSVSANVQSCIVRRDISFVSVFFYMLAQSHTCATPQTFVHVCTLAATLCVSVCGSICTLVVMNDTCDMCCLSGMPGTSGLLNTGPAPIEMAYQWRYIWKNSLPMQSPTTPCQRERKKSLSHSLRLPLYSLPPSLSSPSALYLCLVLEIC